MTKPKVALLIRGHVRDSLNGSNLNNLLMQLLTVIDFDLYLQTWDVAHTNNTWRKKTKFSINKIKESDIYSYFDESLHCRIKSLLILNEDSTEIIGNTQGCVGKSKCPIIGWKYMWSGMYENISKIPEDHNYKFAINTRFDIVNDRLDRICERPIRKKQLVPSTRLDFVNRMVGIRKNGKLKYIYSMYDIIGCDNFMAGSIENIRWLIENFHFKLDEILPMWVESNFKTKHNEACVRWFSQKNNLFSFKGIQTISD